MQQRLLQPHESDHVCPDSWRTLSVSPCILLAARQARQNNQAPTPSRSHHSSGTGSVDTPSQHSSADGSNGGNVNPAAAAAAATEHKAAAAADARVQQVTAQAGVPSGLLRALQHIKSFCSSISGGGSGRSSISSSAQGSKRSSIELPGAAGGAAKRKSLELAAAAAALASPTASDPQPQQQQQAAAAVRAVMPVPLVVVPQAAVVSSSGPQGADGDFADAFGLPVEAMAGVLDGEEQQQLRKCRAFAATG